MCCVSGVSRHKEAQPEKPTPEFKGKGQGQSPSRKKLRWPMILIGSILRVYE
jgi:hypothetical protein